MSAEATRESLDAFCKQDLTVEDLAAKYPGCLCETAAPVEGSPGPVGDEETLRLFLTSPSDIEGKRRSQRERRPFRQGSLQKAFTKDLSIVRIDFATAQEVEYSAGLLYQYQSGRDPLHGGLLSVMDFPVRAVRGCADFEPEFCVLETPLEMQEDGSFLRPSHGDVVNSKSGLSLEQQKAKREVVFNRIVQLGQLRRAEDVADSDLAQYLPQIIVDEGRTAT